MAAAEAATEYFFEDRLSKENSLKASYLESLPREALLLSEIVCGATGVKQVTVREIGTMAPLPYDSFLPGD